MFSQVLHCKEAGTEGVKVREELTLRGQGGASGSKRLNRA
uniref:Uncharacterized protein n=1 Tax=Anguilla anguilla TaxID=7936 RepID=A0A0E9WG90_ANGAN